MKNWVFFLFISYALLFSSKVMFAAVDVAVRRESTVAVKSDHKILSFLPGHRVNHLTMIHQDIFARILIGGDALSIPNALCGYSAAYAAGFMHAYLSLDPAASYEEIMKCLNFFSCGRFFIKKAIKLMIEKYGLKPEEAHMCALGGLDVFDVLKSVFPYAAKDLILLSDSQNMYAKAGVSLLQFEYLGLPVVEDLAIKPPVMCLFVGSTGACSELNARDMLSGKILCRFTEILRGERKCQVFISTNTLLAKGHHWVTFVVRESSVKGKLEALVAEGGNHKSMSHENLFATYTSAEANPCYALPYIVKHMRCAERIAAG